jgi:hypothetical protein
MKKILTDLLNIEIDISIEKLKLSNLTFSLMRYLML